MRSRAAVPLLVSVAVLATAVVWVAARRQQTGTSPPKTRAPDAGPAIAGDEEPDFGPSPCPRAHEREEVEAHRYTDIAVDSAGCVYLAALSVLKLEPSGRITVIAGDGLARDAPARRSHGDSLGLERAGNLYVTDSDTIWRVDPAGNVSVLATALAKAPTGPVYEIAVDADGTVYTTNSDHVHRVLARRPVELVAGRDVLDEGDESAVFVCDWPTAARDADISASDVAVSGSSIYIAQGGVDRGSESTTAVYVIAGGRVRPFVGTSCETGDPASIKGHIEPGPIATDRSGRVFLVSRNRLHVAGAGGSATAIAGTGKAGFSGDGGPATRARLNHPSGLTVGADGTIFLLDSAGECVRRIDTGQVITTILGKCRTDDVSR